MNFVELKNVSVQFSINVDRFPSFKDFILNSLLQRNFLNSKNIFKGLDDVSLKINEGEKIGIVGSNGAGKSTLLKTICKIYEPNHGEINVKGNIAPLLEIGAGFHPEYTGRENIHLNGTLLGYNKKTILNYEKEIISFAEIEDFIDTPVKYYSTGMYLRLGFSIATAVEPQILIMDEMFAGGDQKFIEKASNRMKSLINTANIMLLVSHDLSLIESFCNRVIWLEKGKIKADGNVKEVLEMYKSL